jgi:hypothetical protein
MVERKGSERRRWYGVVGLVALLMGAMLFLYYFYPCVGIGPQQPIPFSHRVHAGVKQINCRFCHPFVERSQNAGIPVLEKCFFCHEYIIPMHPQLVREREHYLDKVPVRWVRIYYLPDYVKFHHRPHVKWAKIACDTCHGPVEDLDRLRTVEFQMGFCISCHREMNAQVDCWLACHH